jgi:hypothetical protein
VTTWLDSQRGPAATMAELYTQRFGWTLVKLRPRTKIPALASWSDGGIATPEQARTQLSPQDNIGILHEPSGTATFDVDHLEYTRLVLAEFGLDYDELMQSGLRIRTREGRDKILCKVPETLLAQGAKPKIKLTWPDQGNARDEAGNLIQVTVFELRSGRNQDMLPPSIHPDTGHPIEWVRPIEEVHEIPEAPEALVTLWANWDAFRPQFEAACPWAEPPAPKSARRVHIPPGDETLPRSDSIIDRYNGAVSCEELLERAGYKRKGKRWLAPGSRTKIPGVVVLENRVYSHHASDLLNDGYAHDAFDLLTLLECGGSPRDALRTAAELLEIPWGESAPSYGVDVSALMANLKNRRQQATAGIVRKTVQEPYQFPHELLEVPGMLGEVAGYINSSSLFPQPILALGASIAFCGALMGRKVATDTDLRTNAYVIGVADSGSGKEHARKALKRLAVAAHAEKVIGAEKLASDQGLFGLLSQHPSCVVLMDEFGRSLRTLGNDRAPAHLQQLMTMLLELTGAADSYIMEKRRAEHALPDRPPLLVQNPNLCIYATTVPGRLYQGLTPDEIVDGFLPRWLVMESDTPDPVMTRTRSQHPPVALVEAVNHWSERTPETDLSNLANPTLRPQVIGTDPKASLLLDDHVAIWSGRKREARGTGLDALWARAYEHALRLALIRAAGRGSDSITEPDIGWACSLTEFLLSRTASQVTANVAANEYEALVQDVTRFLESEGEVTLSQLTRKFRKLKQRSRDEILGSLLDAEQISVEHGPKDGSGRPGQKIVWRGKEGNN